MKQPTPTEALHKAAAYCTHCERCISEVTTKLTAWGIDTQQQASIIHRLQHEGFIDEARYCRAFVNDKVRFNNWGRIKIVAALRNKQLPQQHIRQAIDNIDEEQYTATLMHVIATKQKELKSNNRATQEKIMRHAASRGYEPALIIKAIKHQNDEVDF